MSFTHLLGAVLIGSFSHAAQSTDPNTWDLSIMYKDEVSWQKELNGLNKSIVDLRSCNGHLGDSAEKFKHCLDTLFNHKLRVQYVASWAELQESTDVKNSHFTERSHLAHDLVSKLDQESAFFPSQIAKLGRKKVSGFLGKIKELRIYTQFVREILDHADHLLDPKREELLASLEPVLHTGQEVHGILLTADLPWSTITLSNGEKAKIDSVSYTKLRESSDRSERSKVFDAFYSSLTQFQRTAGATLGSVVMTNVTIAKTRHYPDALSAALDDNKIPAEVYHTLVQQVNAGLPLLQKYLKYQAKSLHVDKMEYYDGYVSSAELGRKFSIEETKSVVLDALAPLGPDYINKLKRAFTQRWMDILPHDGKKNGAYESSDAYGAHPFVFLNHSENFDSVSTFAHEWGHAMHSVYAQESQPYVSSNYSIFIAEIASTLNEILLHEYLIKKATSKKEKTYYLQSLLKMIRTTYFRQTQFAEFELALHQQVENGGALSGEKMSEIYGNIERKYYGHDKGVMNIDGKYFSEWVFVPHFYNSFYVYQYATSLAAAFHFAHAILANEPGAVDNYLKVLKAGSEKYPFEILKEAGLDMTDPSVHQALLKRMESALAELQ